MVSRRKRSNSSVGNKLNNLTDKVTEQQKLQQVSGTQTNAVTNDSIALGAVNTESVVDRSITGNKIGRGEVTSDNLGVINEIIASGGLDIDTGVDGHLSLSGGKYEEPYDGIEDADGYKIVAFDPADNTVKIIDETPVVNLDNILDVDVTGVTDNQVLAYDEGTTTWGPVTIVQTPPTTVSDKSADYTIVSSDKNNFIRSTSTAITITLANVLAAGESIQFIQAGTGQITFAAGAGVTLTSADSYLKTAKQYAGVSVVCAASGVYHLIGNLGA